MIYDTKEKKFIDIYGENLDIRRLIKNRVFFVKNDNTNLVVKITHMKPNENWSYEIDVNIKVSGTISNWWGSERNVNSRYGFHSTVSRNRDIRSAINGDIKNFLKLFGVPGYNVGIKKVNVCDKV
jgi:hypothetical protein